MQHTIRKRTTGALTAFAPLAAILAVSGCASPLVTRSTADLKRSIVESARRELAEAAETPAPVTVPQENRLDALRLPPETIEELDTIAGPTSYSPADAPLGANLLGSGQTVIAVSLERAVRAAATNNLNIQFARLGPAISEAELISAQAAFDWVFFSNFTWNRIDEPRTLGSTFGGVSTDERQSVETEIGVRRRAVTNGSFSVSHAFTYTDVNTPGLTSLPNPARQASILMRIEQPLLRGFGSDVALADVRLARNAELDDVQTLRADLIQTITQTEQAYWELVRAYRNLMILQRLYERGEEVRIKLDARLGFDAKQSEYADAVATVESRRSDVLRARNSLRKASNALKVLMNDPTLTIGSEVLLVPVDSPIAAPIAYSLVDAMDTALDNRPEIHRALLSIDNTAIRRTVADNARLPLLNFRAETRFIGMGGSTSDAYSELTDGHFVDYLVGFAFEQPIGNRGAEANYRADTFRQMQAIIAYRNTVQQVVLEIKNALLDLTTNFALIEQTRASRFAAAERLRTRLVEEEFTAPTNPAFLDLKLRDQQRLAAAEQDEVNALVEYNVALARYYAALGTALRRNNIHFDVADPTDTATSSPVYPFWDDRPRDSTGWGEFNNPNPRPRGVVRPRPAEVEAEAADPPAETEAVGP